MIEAALLGAGQRGHDVYGGYALRHPDRLRFVAVAEPNPVRRSRLVGEHGAAGYEDWESLLADQPPVDAVVVATPDRLHVEPVTAALTLGYAVLVEKPVAVDAIGLHRVYEAVGEGILHVAHVLRATPLFRAVHDIVTSGRLGTILNVSHRENVAFWHYAHSYVRGNWKREADSSPFLLAKACHDLDLIAWNLGPISTVASFGGLTYFTPEHAPPGATPRCTDGCPAAESCPFDARRFYLGSYTGWPVSTISDDLDPASRLEALRTGPYGRCVFSAGNDVVDHQVVAMEAATGASATLTVHGVSYEDARTFRYDGSVATLRGSFGMLTGELELYDNLTGEREPVDLPIMHGGHGGGDDGIIDRFVRAVEGDPEVPRVVDVSQSHLLAFAAEASRMAGGAVQALQG